MPKNAGQNSYETYCATTPLPGSWRAHAEASRVADVMHEWNRFLKFNMGKEISERAQDMWSAWLRSAKKLTESPPPERINTYRQPPEWERDKATLEQAIAASTAIVEGRVWTP